MEESNYNKDLIESILLKEINTLYKLSEQSALLLEDLKRLDLLISILGKLQELDKAKKLDSPQNQETPKHNFSISELVAALKQNEIK